VLARYLNPSLQGTQHDLLDRSKGWWLEQVDEAGGATAKYFTPDHLEDIFPVCLVTTPISAIELSTTTMHVIHAIGAGGRG
jgi:hypothetical protein